jgi:N-acetylmuramoyl-L-alanine amidase
MQRNLGFKSRGVKFANFQVLRETKDYFACVLVEFGFLSNRDEREYFYKSSNIKAMALAILMGIDKHLKTQL